MKNYKILVMDIRRKTLSIYKNKAIKVVNS